MTDKETFLRQIIESPNDLILKSVYADWLQQNGETEFERDHGEFIWRTLQPRKPSELPFVPEWLVRSLFAFSADIASIRQYRVGLYDDAFDLIGHNVCVNVAVCLGNNSNFDTEITFHNGLVVGLSWPVDSNFRKYLGLVADCLTSHHPITNVCRGFSLTRGSNWKADLLATVRGHPLYLSGGVLGAGSGSRTVGGYNYGLPEIRTGSGSPQNPLYAPPLTEEQTQQIVEQIDQIRRSSHLNLVVPQMYQYSQMRAHTGEQSASAEADQTYAPPLTLEQTRELLDRIQVSADSGQTYVEAMRAGLREMAARFGLPPEILEAGLPLNSRPRVVPADHEMARLAAEPIQRMTGHYVTTPPQPPTEDKPNE